MMVRPPWPWVLFSLTLYFATATSILDLELQLTPISSYSLLTLKFNNTWHPVCDMFSVPGLTLPMTDTLASELCRVMGYSTGIYHNTSLLRADSSTNITAQPVTIWCPSLADLTNCSVRDSGCTGSSLLLTCGEAQGCTTVVDESHFTRTQCYIEDTPVYQCHNGKEFYRIEYSDARMGCIFSHKCRGDSSHYMACGCPGVFIEEGQCKSDICPATASMFFGKLRAIPTMSSCNGWYGCIDKSDEPYWCEHLPGLICTPVNSEEQGHWVPQRYMCDSYKECLYGEDESNCGHTNGMHCIIQGREGWIDKSSICNSVEECDDGGDERNCQMTIALNCTEYGTGLSIGVRDNERCLYPESSGSFTPRCEGYIDQMNCSERNVIECTVQGIARTKVSAKWMCNKKKYCDQGEDELCTRIDKDCSVHKHQICDGIPQCNTGADEAECEGVTSDIKCQRLLMLDEPMVLPIPLTWLCDGVVDCVGGEDENTALWSVCGIGRATKCYPKSFGGCDTGFICPDAEGVFVPFTNLCDYDESCAGAERELCSVIQDIDLIKSYNKISTNARDNGSYEFIAPCLPGLISEGNINCHIIYKGYTSTESGALDLRRHQPLPTDPHICANTYGEQYMNLICDGKCADINTTCPLSNVTQTDCAMEDLLYTLDNNNKIKALFKTGSVYQDQVFECDNGECIDHTKICNMMDDCSDGTDEKNCLNSFTCTAGSPKYIRHGQLCDGSHDCFDSSDECGEQCPVKTLIDSPLLRLAAFIIGFVSFISNIYIICKGVREVKSSKRNISFANHFFVMLIAVGDLCTAAYLLNIVMVDVLHGKSYCNNMFEWMTSNHCSFLGVLSTFGSGTSLLSMVGLSLYRAITLAYIFSAGELSKKYVVMIFLAGLGIVSVSLSISVIPILQITEDYFTNGILYKNNSLFNKISTLDDHTQVINLYKTIKGEDTQDSYSWEYIRSHIRDEMFTSGYKGVTGPSLKFYGNDGVCLFKYFVDKHDPQRTFSLCVLCYCLCCFACIISCYVFIFWHSNKIKQQYTQHNKSNQDQYSAQKRTLQRKISLIILSDFMCWVPFSVLCFLHTFGVIDGTPYYQFSAIILIPINGLINPTIYSNMLTKLCKNIKTAVRRMVRHYGPSKEDSTAHPQIELSGLKAEKNLSKLHSKRKKMSKRSTVNPYVSPSTTSRVQFQLNNSDT